MVWTTAYINSLPDSSFLWIGPDGQRHLPYKDADGKIDMPHLRAAASRFDQVDGMSSGACDRIKAKIQSLLGSSSMSERFLVPGEESSFETLELADGGGTRFYKQIVKFGNWVNPLNPSQKMNLNKSWGQKIVQNFKDKRAGRVAVPLTHTDEPQANSGELVDVDMKDDGLWGTFDIRQPKTAQAIKDDLIWDNSISFDNHYIDKRTGEDVGPTLLHVALVNNPYVKGMSPFKALADGMNATMLSESKEKEMSKVTQKNERDFPVTVSYMDGDTEREHILAPGEEFEVPADAAQLVKSQIQNAEQPKPEDKKSEPDKPEPKKEPDKSDDNEELKKQLSEVQTKLRERDANDAYKTLLSEGKIVPAQKDAFIALSLSEPTTVNLSDGKTKSSSQLLTDLLSAGPKRIDFSEKGKLEGEAAPKTAWDALTDEERAANDRLGVDKETYNKHNSAPEASEPDKGDDE